MSCLSTSYRETGFSVQASSANGRPLHLKRNQLVLLKNYPYPAVFYIERGMVIIGGSLAHDKETIHCLLPEDHIFFSSVNAEDNRVNFAQACTDEVQLRVYQESQIQTAASRDNRCQQELLAYYQKYIKSMERQIQLLSSPNIHRKIAQLVLFLADHYGYRRNGVTYIPHTFTHSEIGRILGISRQTITQNLRELQALDFLNYHHREFIIDDYEKFQKIVNSKD